MRHLFDTILEHSFDLLARHEMRKTHRGQKLGTYLVRRAGILQRREQVLPARFRDLVDLAVRFAFLRDMPALDQPVAGQGVECGVDRAVAGGEKVAERGLELFLQVIARGLSIGKHAQADGLYIHCASFRRPVSPIYRGDVLY